MDLLLSLTLRPFRYFTRLASGEFFLTTSKKRANGGGIVLARSILSSVVVFFLALVAEASFAEGKLAFPALTQISKNVPWFGAIWVAVYFGLYARFASQWTYLAGLYNQIKASEIAALAQLVGKDDKNTEKPIEEVMRKLAEWKAGFIEDAENIQRSRSCRSSGTG
jgi:hypothetical protein